MDGDPPQPATWRPNPRGAGPADAVRVLLIARDDDVEEQARDTLARVEQARYVFGRAKSADDGLGMLSDAAADVCLIGSGIVEDNGLRFLATAAAAAPRIPLLLLAHPSLREFAEQAAELGAADCLFRDEVTPPLLHRAIRHALERLRLQLELRRSQERNEIMARASTDGFWDWDIESNRVYFSSRWKAMLGLRDEEVGDNPDEWIERVHPQDARQFRAEITAHLEGNTPHFQNEHRLRTGDGAWRWVLSRGYAALNEWGQPTRMAGILADINDRKVVEAQLRKSAFYDPLTGLPNRAIFLNRLGRAMERARRRGDYVFAVIFLGLDGFKQVNDRLGHEAGDQLLVAISRRLEACLRGADTVGRLGGDEFAVLLNDLKHPDNAVRAAERILAKLATPFHLSAGDVHATASIGLALSSGRHRDPDEMLRAADVAMYKAKSAGNARLVVFDEGPADDVESRRRMEAALREALRTWEEFEVWYQPIYRLETGALAAFEALVRWRRPDGALVPPAAFIPVAERAGLMAEVDHRVLREACRQLKAWRDLHPGSASLRMEVNLSKPFLQQPTLGEAVREAIREAGLELTAIGFEITAGDLIEEAAASVLSQLEDLSVVLRVDEFQAGRSSISPFVRYNVDALKIDGAYVSNMGSRGENQEIVRAIANLAHNLGMEVIAEGVETARQRDQLKGLRCEFAQGYLFSRPLVAADAEALLIAEGEERGG